MSFHDWESITFIPNSNSSTIDNYFLLHFHSFKRSVVIGFSMKSLFKYVYRYVGYRTKIDIVSYSLLWIEITISILWNFNNNKHKFSVYIYRKWLVSDSWLTNLKILNMNRIQTFFHSKRNSTLHAKNIENNFFFIIWHEIDTLIFGILCYQGIELLRIK